MKYKSEKTLRRAKKAFSLIELMIVIVIIGALTAIILPQFDISEAEAKDTACDTSNYGTLRQLASFRSINGVYPMGFHTGYESVDGTNEMGAGDYCQALPDYTNQNIANLKQTLTNNATDGLYADSLAKAGIAFIAYGGYPKNSDDATEANFKLYSVSNTYNSETGAVSSETGSVFGAIAMITDGGEDDDTNNTWYEENARVDDTEGFTGEAPLTINGVELKYYTYPNAHLATTSTTSLTQDGAVVALFVTPNIDWDNYYNEDGEIEGQSRLGVAQVGGCPWLEGGADFRYYIAFFKVFKDGSAAKLLGTSCPEGGSLNP